jgi:glycosyltransferase involved in cell wall biosynthesis
MKIAVISNHAPALMNFRGPLLMEMVRQGHDVLAFAPNHDESSRSDLIAIGVTPLHWSMDRAGMNPLKDCLSLIKLWTQLRRHQPDIVFSSAIKPVIYGTIAAWAARTRRRFAMIEGLGFAFTAHEPGRGGGRKLTRWLATNLYRIALSLSQRTIFLNDDDRTEFIKSGLVRAERSVVLGGIGLDLEEWRPAPLPAGPVTFILVARLLWDKGVGEYIEAARRVRLDYPKARFLLLGALDENPSAISAATVQQWLDDGILDVWPGHVPVRPWLEQASVFVLPSYREGVPRSTQEAMAMGRPVITTDVPGCRDTVIDGVSGFKILQRDPASLAEAMRRFLDRPEITAPMGQESRRLAEKKFDVHIQNEKLLGFMDLAGEASKGVRSERSL